MLQSNSQYFNNFQSQGRALHSEGNSKNILVSPPRDRNNVRFCGCSYRGPCAEFHVNLLTLRKVKKSQLMKPQGQTLTGSGLYLSFLSKSDPLCGRHLVVQYNLTKQVHRAGRSHARQRPPPASTKFSAKQLWSSCSSSTCENSLTGNRQTRAIHARTEAT